MGKKQTFATTRKSRSALLLGLAFCLVLALPQAQAAPAVHGQAQIASKPSASKPSAPKPPDPPVGRKAGSTGRIAPRFGMPEVLAGIIDRAPPHKSTVKPTSQKTRPPANLSYFLRPRDSNQFSSFAKAPLGAAPDSTGQKPHKPFTVSGQAIARDSAEGFTVSPVFSSDWKQEFRDRQPPVSERFAPVVTKAPDSFTSTHWDEGRDNPMIGIDLDGLFHTDTGRPWSFKAGYGLDMRENAGDHTVYGGVEWRF